MNSNSEIDPLTTKTKTAKPVKEIIASATEIEKRINNVKKLGLRDFFKLINFRNIYLKYLMICNYIVVCHF